MRARVAESIRAFAEHHWDAVAGGDLLMTHRWQRVMEAGGMGYRPSYVLLEDDRGPLGTAVAHRAALSAGPPSSWPGAALRRLSTVLSAPLSAAHGGVAVRPGAALEVVLPHLERALAGPGRREGRLLIGANNVGQEALPQWRARGYLALARPPDMVLDLPLPRSAAGAPAGYDDYLQTLSSRQRHELRRVRRRGEAHGVRVSPVSPAGRGAALHPLLCEVFVRHGVPAAATPFTPALFDALAREMPAEAVVFEGTVAGELAGFGLCLVQGDTLVWPLIGMRYDLAAPSGLYFWLIDEGVRWGLSRGVRRIHGGVTNERQKGRHGFRPRPRWFCLRARPAPLHGLLAVTLRLGQRHAGFALQ